MSDYAPDFVPMLKILTDSTVCYLKWATPKRRYDILKVKRETSLTLSQNTCRRIRRLTAYMFDCSKWKRVYCVEDSKFHWFRLSFLTLTLPSSQLTDSGAGKNYWFDKFITFDDKNELLLDDFKVTDNTIKSDVLARYLDILREKYDVQNYIWKAEAQQNGNIHIHLILDKFIHWHSLQYRWNKLLEIFGFVTEFEKKWGHRDPNTIKVHAIHSMKNAKHYLLKYMNKTEDSKRKIFGKRWSCSESISNYDGITIPLEGLKFLEWQNSFVRRSHYAIEVHFCTVYSFTLGQFITLYEGTELLAEYLARFKEKYHKTIDYN